MSGVQGIQSNIPVDFGTTLTCFASAKQLPKEQEALIPSIFNQVVTLPTKFESGQNVKSGIELLKQLRATYQSSLTESQDALKQASAKDKRIPLIGVTILRSKESRDIHAKQATLKAHEAKFSALQKQLEQELAKLTKAQEAIRNHGYSVALAQAPVATNQDIKLNGPEPKLLYINGNHQHTIRGMFEGLFDLLDMQKGEALDRRVATFGTKEGIAPEQLNGRDLDLLKACMPARFDAMQEAFYAHVKQAKFTHRDGSNFFVPTEKLEARKIHVAKDETVTFEAVFALARKEGEEPIATVTCTYVAGESKCRFGNITTHQGYAKLPDYEKLERIFSEKAKIEAPQSASTTA